MCHSPRFNKSKEHSLRAFQRHGGWIRPTVWAVWVGFYGSQRLDRSHHVLLISAVVVDARNFHVLAVSEISTPAFAAGVVVPAVPADPHTLPLRPDRYSGADFVNRPCHLMSRNAGVLNARDEAIFGEYIAVAYTTCLHPNAHLPCIGFRNSALDDLEGRSRFRNLSDSHGRYRSFRGDC